MAGDPRIPYDQTDPMVQVPAPQPGGTPSFEGAAGGGPPAQGGGMPPAAPQDMGALLGGLGGTDQSGAGALAALGGDQGNTDQLTGADLGAMGGDVGSPEDIEVAQLEAALNDPNTPPQYVQAIQQQLALAARRRIAGLGDSGMMAGGGLGA